MLRLGAAREKLWNACGKMGMVCAPLIGKAVTHILFAVHAQLVHRHI